ncbi:MAG: hypothetical protein KF729_11475 [Sandaracinaceae bacterium]|nr:hypothetical protein [Sandaracinaceae bacterium]
MTTAKRGVWSSGPTEILGFGLDLLRRPDSDAHRRIALILIDNAVEQGIKTYLALPRRINGLAISRKEIDEAFENFGKLLDAFEKYAPPDRLARVAVDMIEYYHRVRNSIYHDGLGLTVEREKVDAYAAVAIDLFREFHGIEVGDRAADPAHILAAFLQEYALLEQTLRSAASDHVIASRPISFRDAARILDGTGAFTKSQMKALAELAGVRNQTVHGHAALNEAQANTWIATMRTLREQFPDDDPSKREEPR